MFLLNVMNVNFFLLIQLYFESYFIKLMCMQGKISLHSGGRLATKPQEAFAFGCTLCLLKLC